MLLDRSRHQWAIVLALALSFVPACMQTAREAELPPDRFVVAYIPPDDEDRTALELTLREHVLREVLRWRRSDERVCFIAFGHAENGDWIDPPREFIGRLSDLSLDIRPVSDARLPRNGEMKTSSRMRGVETIDTGEEASIYYVELREWIDDNHAEVDYGRFGGPLDGGAVRRASYERQDGQWRQTTEGQRSIS